LRLVDEDRGLALETEERHDLGQVRKIRGLGNVKLISGS